MRWSAQTPSTTTTPAGSTVRDPRGSPRGPVVRRERAGLARGRAASTTSRASRVDVEALAVPELVGGDDLRPGNHPCERRLPGAAVAADPDEDEPPSSLAAASISSSTGRASIAARYPQRMEKLRLGGMALSNGVLVHGPTSWGAAVRAPDGSIRSASGVKRRFAPNVTTPFVRGPAAARGGVRRASRRAARAARGALPVRAAARRGRRRRRSCGRGHRAPLGARASPRARRSPRSPRSRPRSIALRGGELASYHGAEHISIGTYETGEPATKEHDRCGGHLVGPLLLTSAAASALAARAPASARPAARALGAVGAVGAAVEIFGVDGPPPATIPSRALSRGPGHELQTRVSTAEPSAAQLEVAEAALAACLDGRRGGVSQSRCSCAASRLDPERVRSPRREDAGGLLHRRVLQPHARGAARRRPSPARRDAGLPAPHGDARRDGRGDRGPQALLARLGRARGLRAPRRRHDRAVGDGDDDRGRLHPLRPSRDRLPRRARAAHPDLDQHRARAPRRERQADHLHAGPARPPSRPDRRRLRGVRRRRDARHARSASPPTRRPRGGAAAASAPSRTR